MGKIQIKYNPVLEFFCSIARIVFDKEIKSRELFNDLNLNSEIQSYVDMVNSNMSSLMKSDMELLTKRIAGGLIVPIYFCISRGITELGDFFSCFKEIEGSEYLRMYTEVFEIGDIIDGEPAVIMQNLKNKLNWDFPSEDDVFFPEFKKYPDEMKNRLEALFHLYYEKFYIGIEGKPFSFMRDKVGDYKRQYESDGEDFLSELLATDIKELAANIKQLVLYPSYFYEVGLTHQFVGDSLFILFGYQLEQRAKVDFMERRAKEVLKMLSDEKRYEILKLLGENKYFGAQLSEAINLTKATVSYHINKMVTLGLLNMYFGENNRTYLTLNKKTLKDTLDYIYHDLSHDK